MRALLIFLFVSIAVNGFSQNWKTVPEKDTIYFTTADKALKVTWIDSATEAAADSVFHFYKSIRSSSITSCADTLAATWLGSYFTRSSNGDEYYFNSFNDTILIKTNATLNASWIIAKGNGSNTKSYIATVTQLSTQLVDGATDSIKTISLQAYNNGAPIADWYNNKQLILSKHHGWITALDLYRFPNPITPSYAFGATVDSTQHFRLEKTLKALNLNDDSPLARYAPGNEWIARKDVDMPGGSWPDPSLTLQHDSVISVQTLANGIIATMRTHLIEFTHTSLSDTVFVHADTIAPPSPLPLTDTVLPEYNWHLQNIPTSIFWITNEEYYLKKYTVDTACNGLFELSSNRLLQSNVGLFRDTNNCINVNPPALIYPVIRNWTYLEGFGYTYDYYYYESGDPLLFFHEITYPYIKLGNCIMGSKDVLSVRNDHLSSQKVQIFPSPASNFITIQIPSQVSNATIEAYDNAGRKVLGYTTSEKETRLDISGLLNGIYTFQIITKRGVRTEKVLVIN